MRGFPERYLIFDTESRATKVAGRSPTERLTLRLGSALFVDGRAGRGPRETWYDFRTAAEFHEIIAGLFYTTTPIYVFAHNIAFDVRQVDWMGEMGKGRYTLTPPPATKGAGHYKKPLFIADSPPFIVRLFRPDGQRLILIDTFQWLPASLATIGQWIGEDKWEMPRPRDPDDRWREYCRRDVDVLHGALVHLWSYLRYRRIHYWMTTPAAQAMCEYKRRKNHEPIVPPGDLKVLELDRHAYYGGLVEAFRIGPVKGPLYQLDVTAMYPFIMAEKELPCAVIGHGDHTDEDRIPDSFDPFGCTAEVWLDSPEHPFPVKGSDQTCWCTGKVRTVLCKPELERAWAMGVVRKVGRWTRYKLADLFSRWVEKEWAARQGCQERGMTLGAHVCKLMMNSLHGKFGQRTGEWEPVGLQGPPDRFAYGYSCHMDKPGYSYYRIIAGTEFRKTPDDEDPHGFVPIAAWTSSYARCYMWDMIHLAGQEHVHHVATDSLIVDGIGLGNLQLAELVQEGVIGRFRCESIVERCHIHAANCVDWDDRKKRPGIKRGSKEIAPDIWEVNKWSAFMDDITHKRPDSVTIEALIINAARRFQRRETLPLGSTRPWCIDNWAITPEEQLDMPIGRDRFGEV